MPDFRYTARNANGERVEGVVSANDRSGAISQVEQKGYTPIKIVDAGGSTEKGVVAVAANPEGKAALKEGESSSPAKVEPNRPNQLAVKKQALRKLEKTGVPLEKGPNFKLKLSHSQQYLFTEQLAHLLGAGMTLDESLGILVKRLKQPRLRALAQSLHQSLVDGRSLSQAMRDFPHVFSPLYVNMVSAGEASGAMPIILNRLTIHLAEVKSLRDRVQQALLYPSVLVVVGIGLILVFMTVMVPQLMAFFKDTKAELPAATMMLINLNSLLTKYWWLVISILFGAFVLFKAAVASPSGRYAWHKLKWNFPIFSRIPRYRYYAQFARTLGTLTENGVTLLRALELIEDIAGNDYISAQMTEIRAAVVDGATLSRALGSRAIFPEMFVDMMGVGEQTGKFSNTMTMIADVYERELDKQVQVVSSLLPPMVMVMIAGVIGTVIYGILIAVFNLTSGMGRGR